MLWCSEVEACAWFKAIHASINAAPDYDLGRYTDLRLVYLKSVIVAQEISCRQVDRQVRAVTAVFMDINQ